MVMKHIERALKYIREHVDMSYVKESVIKSMEMRMPIGGVAPMLDDAVYDLLEEYGQDNDLPEMWWASEDEMDEIIDML